MSASVHPIRPGSNTDLRAELLNRIETEFISHLRLIEQVANDHARRLGLGVRVSVDKAVEAARSFRSVTRVLAFLDRADDSGVLHDAQLMTALDCVANMLVEPGRNGLVLGAMQSGKTTTSLALQFAGPIIYLLTGRRFYPFYLVTSHTSQEDQTSIELKKFLDFYGDVEVVLDEEHRCTLIEYADNLSLDVAFQVAPSVDTYRGHVLRNAFADVFMGPRIEDFIQRRVHGQSVQKVADLCRRAAASGFSPLLIIDEPQYGASDRLVPDGEGGVTRRACVLVQIFESIEAALEDDGADQVFIGLSATPYELSSIDAVWKVKQYLTPAYSGFNFFGGEVISAGVHVTPPQTLGFRDFAERTRNPFFAQLDIAAYDGSRTTFDRYCRRTGYAGTWAAYKGRVEDTLRAAIHYMAASAEGDAVGICVRLFNDNRRTENLIRRLRLDPNQIEVIGWFGSDFSGHSVKRAIESRIRKDLPFLIAVTNRARMGDAFPASVRWFLDFSKKASDLNALLQGLLGRACGYNKSSVVVLSDENAQLVRDYEQTDGGLIYKPSRHSVVVGSYRRGAPSSLIRVSADMPDPVVQRFFERLDREVVDEHLDQTSPTFRTRRARDDAFRTAPILRLAEEEGLFDHLENPAVRQQLYPTFADGFRIARAGDQVERSRGGSEPIGYTLDDEGNCRFTFRWTAEDGQTHAGIQSRGYGARDATERARAGNTLEPQIYVRKIDPETGAVIFDKNAAAEEQQLGRWEASVLILPLVKPVRELRAAESTLPVELSPYSALLSREERDAAGYSEDDYTAPPASSE
jgi:hypothetical protein